MKNAKCHTISVDWLLRYHAPLAKATHTCQRHGHRPEVHHDGFTTASLALYRRHTELRFAVCRCGAARVRRSAAGSACPMSS